MLTKIFFMMFFALFESYNLVASQTELSSREFEFLKSMILSSSNDVLAKKLSNEHKNLNTVFGEASLLLSAIRCYEQTDQAIVYALQSNQNVDVLKELFKKQKKVIQMLLRYGAELRPAEAEDFIDIFITQPVCCMNIDRNKRISYEPARIIKRILKETETEDQIRIAQIGSFMAGQARQLPAITRRLNSMLKF